MLKWGFWDWLAYGCIAIAALALAVDQAIKGSPQLVQNFSSLLAAPSWNFAPITLIGISGVIMLLRQLKVIGSQTETEVRGVSVTTTENEFIETNLRLQFFGDRRIPHEISSSNVVVWFAYFSSSLSIQPRDQNGNPVAGGMEIPPNWVVFIALDKPTSYKQVIVSFSNPEVMPIIDTQMTHSRVIAISTRDQMPAGVLTVETKK